MNHDQESKEKNSSSYNQQPKSRSWKIDRHRRCWWEVYRLAQSHFVGKDHTGLSHLKRLGILLDLALWSHLSLWNITHLKFSLFPLPQVYCLMSLQHLNYHLSLHLETLLTFLILALLPFLLYLWFLLILLIFLSSSASTHPNCSVQDMVICISRTQEIGLDQG